MLTSRWRKIAADLSANKLRTFLVILAMFIGLSGFSIVADSYSILIREMNKNYMNTNPASATIWTKPLDQDILDEIKGLPYIEAIEEREKIIGRVKISDNEWKDIWLYVVTDFNNLRIDTFTLEPGCKPPVLGEILVERAGLSIIKTSPGNAITVKIPGGNPVSLLLTGQVHAPGLAPSWMEGHAYGFITPETFAQLDGKVEQTELKLIVSGDALDKRHIQESVNKLTAYLVQKGIDVQRIEIPRPGKHPHYDQMATLLFMMEVFGLLALVLGSILVANMISALMEQKSRELALMKAIGARTVQLTTMYLTMVVCLSTAAILPSLPVGLLIGRQYANIAASILNFTIYDNSVPHLVIGLEALIGMLIPLVIAFYPIIKSTRISIREAMNNYGLPTDFKKRSSRHMEVFTGWIPRPFLVSIRNTFRKKVRLILTLLVMAAGGTGFIIAMNIYASMYNTVDERVKAIDYDIQLSFDQPYKDAVIKEEIESVRGVSRAEAWGGASAAVLYENGTVGNAFTIIAPPPKTELMSSPPLIDGRWLLPEDENALVVNQKLLSSEPSLNIGSEVLLNIKGTNYVFHIVGVTQEIAGMPQAYMNGEYIQKLTGLGDKYTNAVVLLNDDSKKNVQEISKALEERLDKAGIRVSTLLKISDYKKAVEDHLLLIATFLIVMSVLVVIVGGLGLASTISLNVMERTRELGVMRVIGSTPASIAAIVVSEGMVIGALSWLISSALSLPLSKLISTNFGMIFFQAPLVFAPSLTGYLSWLAIVIVFAGAASLYPALKAIRMTVRSAISYE